MDALVVGILVALLVVVLLLLVVLVLMVIHPVVVVLPMLVVQVVVVVIVVAAMVVVAALVVKVVLLMMQVVVVMLSFVVVMNQVMLLVVQAVVEMLDVVMVLLVAVEVMAVVLLLLMRGELVLKSEGLVAMRCRPGVMQGLLVVTNGVLMVWNDKPKLDRLGHGRILLVMWGNASPRKSQTHRLIVCPCQMYNLEDVWLGQTLLCYTLRSLKTSRFVKSWVVS
jgi:hypothetical protein